MSENNTPENKPENLSNIIPAMNVSVPAKAEDTDQLIADSALMGMYSEIFGIIKKDTQQVNDILDNFVNMVINDGDSSTSSKEAMVNLLKIKTEQADKMTRVADLMTRIKLKERDTFPKYLAASQNNTINIGGANNKRALLEAINKAKKKPKEEKSDEST